MYSLSSIQHVAWFEMISREKFYLVVLIVYNLDFSKITDKIEVRNKQCNKFSFQSANSLEVNPDMACLPGQMKLMKLSSSVLHQQLGHPSSQTLSLIIKTKICMLHLV